jgi:hypothetical protein
MRIQTPPRLLLQLRLMCPNKNSDWLHTYRHKPKTPFAIKFHLKLALNHDAPLSPHLQYTTQILSSLAPTKTCLDQSTTSDPNSRSMGQTSAPWYRGSSSRRELALLQIILRRAIHHAILSPSTARRTGRSGRCLSSHLYIGTGGNPRWGKDQ